MNLLTAFDVYLTEVDSDSALSPKQRRQKQSETLSMMLLALKGMGWNGCRGRRATKQDVADARGFMVSIPIGQFPELRRSGLRHLKTAEIPESSRRVHLCRFRQCFDWMQTHHWPRHHQRPNIVEDCAPRLVSRYGSYEHQPLTGRQGQLTRYRLRSEQFSEAFRAERRAFERFLTRPQQPGRFGPAVKLETAQQYLRDFDFFAGFCCLEEGVVPAEIAFTTLLPVLEQAELEAMTPAQRKARWKPLVSQLEVRICDYLEFLLTENQSISPRTRYHRVSGLLAIGRYLYADWMEVRQDYKSIPVLKILKRFVDEALEAVKRWQDQDRYVASMADKMPTPMPGQTVLEACREQILEPQVAACSPRDSGGHWRKPVPIARSLQSANQMAFCIDRPARRSQDYRSLLVAESCPIEPPESVPPGGVLFPCPPQRVRPQNQAGELLDNLIFRTYTYQGIYYPEGVWVMQLNQYKTRKRMGIFEVILENTQFKNGVTFYDLLETYFMGMWRQDDRCSTVYDWGHLSFQGQRGRWLSAGRMEFQPRSSVVWKGVDNVSHHMGYVFLRPRLGAPFPSASEFASLMSHRAFRLSGKKLTPHTMRYVWATWAGQKQLADGPLRALAYMMGHSVEVLRRMYQKLSSGDYQQIFEVARQECEAGQRSLSMDQVMGWARSLSPVKRRQLLRHIQALLEEGNEVA